MFIKNKNLISPVSLFALAYSIYSVAGCATPRISPHLISEQELVEATFLDEEKKGLSDEQWGLALSGGGSRSASFNIGVLKALYQNGRRGNQISRFHYLSSVSGGSWASYWFYSNELFKHNILGKRTNDECPENFENYSTNDMFATKEEFSVGEPVNSFRFQNHLENSSEFITVTKSQWLRYFEGGLTGLYHGLETITLHKVVDGAFDINVNTSVLQSAYRKGLERAYGFVPCDLSDPEQYSFANQKHGSIFLWNKAAQANEISFSDLSYLIKKRANGNPEDELFRLPIPIINTAMGSNGETSGSFEKSVFWITPFVYGSAEQYNYLRPYKALTFSQSVAASGAAVDGQARGINDIADAGMWLADLNLGYKVPNPRSGQNAYFNTGLLPWPLYWITNEIMESNYFEDSIFHGERPFVHLSDGGHADNLGVYALINRQIDNIVAIDAEHDPEMSYEGLKRLSDRLRIELGYKLQPRSNNKIFEPGRIDNKNSLVIFDLIPDIAVLRPITIYYLKLSFDEERMGLSNGQRKNYPACAINPADALGKNIYPCSVVDFYKSDFNKPRSNRFPQNSTIDISYDALQYRAYRDLGYVMTMEQILTLDDIKKM